MERKLKPKEPTPRDIMENKIPLEDQPYTKDLKKDEISLLSKFNSYFSGNSKLFSQGQLADELAYYFEPEIFEHNINPKYDKIYKNFKDSVLGTSESNFSKSKKSKFTRDEYDVIMGFYACNKLQIESYIEKTISASLDEKAKFIELRSEWDTFIKNWPEYIIRRFISKTINNYRNLRSYRYIIDLSSCSPFDYLADKYYCLFPKTSDSEKNKKVNKNNKNYHHYNIGELIINKKFNKVEFKLEIPYQNAYNDESKNRIKKYTGYIIGKQEDNENMVYVELFRYDVDDPNYKEDKTSILFKIYPYYKKNKNSIVKNVYAFAVGLVLTTCSGEENRYPTVHRIILSNKPIDDPKKIANILPMLRLSGKKVDRIDKDIQESIMEAYYCP